MREFVTQMVVVLNLALGRMPLIVRLFDLRARPSAARVAVSRRRQLEYAELFSPADRDGRRAAPFHRAEQPGAERDYRWVDSA